MNIIEAAKAMVQGKTVKSEYTGLGPMTTGKHGVIGTYDNGFFYLLNFEADDLLADDYEVVE